jgi:hypothetical protein
MRLSRQGFVGEMSWDLTWPGLVALVAMTVVGGLSALRALMRLAP